MCNALTPNAEKIILEKVESKLFCNWIHAVDGICVSNGWNKRKYSACPKCREKGTNTEFSESTERTLTFYRIQATIHGNDKRLRKKGPPNMKYGRINWKPIKYFIVKFYRRRLSFPWIGGCSPLNSPEFRKIPQNRVCIEWPWVVSSSWSCPLLSQWKQRSRFELSACSL